MHTHYKILGSLVVVTAASILIAELPRENEETVAPIEVNVIESERAAPVSGGRSAGGQTSAMMREVRDAVDAEKATLAALRSKLDGTDHETALATQREIERAKQETELRILRIQAEHARRAGRTEQATQIEQAIQDTTRPPVNPAPSPRPAPAERNKP
jgi:hypothetical protein